MIKVLYSFPLRIGVPGIGMTAWYQINSLLKKGLEVHLYCGSCEKPIDGLATLQQTMKLANMKVPIRLLGRHAFSLHDSLVSRILKAKGNSIDLVHCWPSGAKKTLEAARKLGIKSVLERPSAHTEYVYEKYEAECKKLGLRMNSSHYATYNRRRLQLEKAEFELADRLLCPSDFVQRTFLDKGFLKSKLAKHQYGYDPKVFKLTEGNKDTCSSFTMCYVGDCFPLKGLHFALEAWLMSAASENGRFYICGRFMEGYKKLLHSYLEHPSVTCLGHLKDVASIMEKSHVLMLPSLAEGSALVTYEARACGCVLMVSKASGAVCEHMHNGLLHEPGDVKTLSKQIDLLSSDPCLYREIRERSIADLDHLTWDYTGELLMGIYSTLVKETQ